MTEAEEHQSERALATIRVIEEIRPIEGADQIEAARVDGWWVVVKKGEFVVNDLAVYFECDSFLPQRPEFEFLRKSSFRKNWDGSEGFRLKTIKLRGQISQGLLLPLDAFGEKFKEHFPEFFEPFISGNIFSNVYGPGNLVEFYTSREKDISKFLGVTKWEKPISPQLAGVARGNFPSFIPKTDEHRIQNLGRQRKEMQDANKWFVREKLDGSSMTVYLNEGTFGVCSRNLDLKETDDNAFWQMARRLDLETKLRDLAPVFGIAIQGELVGPGIQGNPYKLPSPQFYVFGVYDIVQGHYVRDVEMCSIAADLGLHVAPLYAVLPSLPETTQDILELSERKSLINHNVEAEGCVWRHYDGNALKYSFKAISNRYLLKEKD